MLCNHLYCVKIKKKQFLYTGKINMNCLNKKHLKVSGCCDQYILATFK